DIAARGRYTADAVAHLPADIREKYFTIQDDFAIVAPQIRKQVVFAKHNVLKDPPFIKNDLVSCRNLLIYLNTTLQQALINALYFSLLQDGYLFLGPSENPSIGPELEEVNSRWKIYRKKGSGSRAPYTNDNRITRNMPVLETRNKAQVTSPLPQDFARSLTEDFGFAAVYVNEQYEVKEVIGDFRKYLSLPEQLVNLNILRMVPVELSGLLSSAFRKVTQEKAKFVLRNTRINISAQYANQYRRHTAQFLPGGSSASRRFWFDDGSAWNNPGF
ncbi:MAG: hypothetical protein EOP49_53060, partial [Sphingobacteriales bacterium]